ncbi:MAG: pentapeptide repeat-containing protein [Spirulinaceae cyanobacterium SM2_1_0]|nr:pentapeptide repeat-containing protein [Spirulinaceae cyanobacterium SM2_1_0]
MSDSKLPEAAAAPAPALAERSADFTIPEPSPQRRLASELPRSGLIGLAIALGVAGWALHLFWLLFASTLVTLLLSLQVVLPGIQRWLLRFLTPAERQTVWGLFGIVAALIGLGELLGFYAAVNQWLARIKWDEFGSWAEWVGAVGQIAIAVIAVYVAWQQYVISRDLTLRQNAITQQQTIDAYFQGISDLALSDEGLLEDWPQERAFAEGRTAAILSSVDAAGKAKILRFLSQSKLLTPLRRDGLLGRAILDGVGGYQEDRADGLRVIDLGVMLARADLAGTDLRWTDLSDAYMVGADLQRSDLVKANLSRAVLYEAKLADADLKGARLFYGPVETASPRSLTLPPDYQTGAHSGTVVEKADFSRVQRLSDEQRYYCCCWGGEQTRNTIPGGCEGIPNKLGR